MQPKHRNKTNNTAQNQETHHGTAEHQTAQRNRSQHNNNATAPRHTARRTTGEPHTDQNNTDKHGNAQNNAKKKTSREHSSTRQQRTTKTAQHDQPQHHAGQQGARTQPSTGTPHSTRQNTQRTTDRSGNSTTHQHTPQPQTHKKTPHRTTGTKRKQQTGQRKKIEQQTEQRKKKQRKTPRTKHKGGAKKKKKQGGGRQKKIKKKNKGGGQPVCQGPRHPRPENTDRRTQQGRTNGKRKTPQQTDRPKPGGGRTKKKDKAATGKGEAHPNAPGRPACPTRPSGARSSTHARDPGVASSDPKGAVSASTLDSPGAPAEFPVKRWAVQETGRVSDRVHTRQPPPRTQPKTDAGGTRQRQPHRGAPNGYNAERAQSPCLGRGQRQAQGALFSAGLHVPCAGAQ